MRQMVWELRTLLDRADVQPPYVLVGHSYGGMLARLFAFTYPLEVVGIVLDEGLHESDMRVQRGGVVMRLVDTATGAAVPAVRTSDPLRASDIPPDVRGRLDAAARQMPAHASGEVAGHPVRAW
jgi:pimeloyl-ACP methyl ester carboxylesterase